MGLTCTCSQSLEANGLPSRMHRDKLFLSLMFGRDPCCIQASSAKVEVISAVQKDFDLTHPPRIQNRLSGTYELSHVVQQLKVEMTSPALMEQ